MRNIGYYHKMGAKVQKAITVCAERIFDWETFEREFQIAAVYLQKHDSNFRPDHTTLNEMNDAIAKQRANGKTSAWRAKTKFPHGLSGEPTVTKPTGWRRWRDKRFLGLVSVIMASPIFVLFMFIDGSKRPLMQVLSLIAFVYVNSVLWRYTATQIEEYHAKS